jgi:hypothetical protein
MKRALVIAVIALGTLGFPGLARADAPWQCDPGICRWGFNHVTPTVNSYVPSPWNWWSSQYVDKRNGGTVSHGFISNSNVCSWTLSGVNTVVRYSDDSAGGCGNYCHSWISYVSGNSSYLYTDVIV